MGNLADHIFLKAQCLARILQHVSPLAMAALACNILLHTVRYPTAYLIIWKNAKDKVRFANWLYHRSKQLLSHIHGPLKTNIVAPNVADVTIFH